MADAVVSTTAPAENPVGDPPGSDKPRKRPEAAAKPDPVLALPFVRDLPSPKPNGVCRSFWTHDRAGLDYTTGCIVGRDWAVAAVRYGIDHDMLPVLGWAVADMPRDPEGGEKGLQVGFLGTWAELAILGARTYGLDRYERFLAERDERMRRMCGGEAGRG